MASTLILWQLNSQPLPAWSAKASQDLSAVARSQYDQGRFAEAEKTYTDIWQADTKIAGPRLQQFCRDLLGLARAQAAQEKWQAAALTFERASTLSETIGMPRTFMDEVRAGKVEAQTKLNALPIGTGVKSAAPIPPVVSSARRRAASMRGIPLLGILNSSSFANGRYDEDEQEYLHKCLVHYTQHVNGPTSKESALSNLELATFYTNLREFASAKEPLQQAVNILPQLKSNDQTTVASAMLDMAARLADSDQLPSASLLADAVLRAASLEPAYAPELSGQFNRLSGSLMRKQDYAKAETYEKFAVTLLEKTLPKSDQRLAQERLKLASLFDSEGKSSTAIEMYELALPAASASVVDASTLKSQVALANLYLKTENKAKAAAGARELASNIARLPADQDLSWCAPCLELSSNFARHGDAPQARQLYTQVLSQAAVAMSTNAYDFQINQALTALVGQLEQIGNLEEAEHVLAARIEASKTPAGETVQAETAYADMCQFCLRHDMFDKAKIAADKMISTALKFGHGSRFHYRLSELVRAFEQKEQHEEALVILQTEIELAGDPAKGDSKELVNSLTQAACILDKMGDHVQAAATIKKAATSVANNLPADLSALAPQLDKLLTKQVDTGKITSASQILTQVAQYQWLSRHQSGSLQFANGAWTVLAAAFESEQMYEPALVLYKKQVDWQTKQYGESSWQAGQSLQSLSRVLRNAGKDSQATEMEEAAKAISDLYMRQQRGENGVYKPFAPLTETIRNARLGKMPADSAT